MKGAGVDLTFKGVQNLSGAGGGDNTLTIDPGGTLSGIFDGGAGGKNALMFDNGPHQAAALSIGPVDDTITLDGQALSYLNVQSTDLGDPIKLDLSGDADEILQSRRDAGQWRTESPMRDDVQHDVPADGGLAIRTDPRCGRYDHIQRPDRFRNDRGGRKAAGAFVIDGSGSSIEFAGDLTD